MVRGKSLGDIVLTLVAAAVAAKFGVDVARADEFNLGIGGDGGVGGSILYTKHTSGASEGSDGDDLTWASAPANPNSQWFKLYTDPFSEDLRRDARPLESETVFQMKGKPVDGLGTGVTSTNYLIVMIPDADPNRT